MKKRFDLNIQPKAFTIVEVVVALGLFASALTVLSLAVHSSYLSLFSFETQIQHEEDLRFLRHHLPYVLSKEELLRGGKVRVPHAGVVHWSAIIEPTNILNCHKIILSYDFEDKAPIQETYLRYIRNWISPDEVNTISLKKREGRVGFNRLQPTP